MTQHPAVWLIHPTMGRFMRVSPPAVASEIRIGGVMVIDDRGDLTSEAMAAGYSIETEEAA